MSEKILSTDEVNGAISSACVHRSALERVRYRAVRDSHEALRAQVEQLTGELSETQGELDKLLEYARKVKGARDVHSIYEVLDLIPKLTGEVGQHR